MASGRVPKISHIWVRDEVMIWDLKFKKEYLELPLFYHGT
jgi:hypothetical protein